MLTRSHHALAALCFGALALYACGGPTTEASDMPATPARPAPAAGATDTTPAERRTRGTPPRVLFTEYLDHTGHARDDRVLALFDTLLDEASDPEPA